MGHATRFRAVRNALCAAAFVVTSFGVVASDGPRVVAEASADNADLGLAITKCFHPTADFVRGSLGEKHTDDGRTAQNGRVDFRGGITGKAYFMEFVMHHRTKDGDREIRVTPGTDTAPWPPNPNCSLRNWTRIN